MQVDPIEAGVAELTPLLEVFVKEIR